MFQVSIRSLIVAAAVTATAVVLAAAPATAHAMADVLIAVEACPQPAVGRDPPAAYMRQNCGVSSPGSFAAAPSIEVLATDLTAQGSGVIVTLWCTHRSTGVRTAMATVSSRPAARPAVFSSRLAAPLDLTRYACHFQVDQSVTQTGPNAFAHVVALRP